MKDIERVMKALANRRRLMILRHLQKVGKASVGEIAGSIKLSLKATSKHLRLLAASDLVEHEQVSLTMIYFLNKPLHPILKTVLTFSNSRE
ncbi:ArsR family transcriptional regulator [Candidatus Uhrbacteria bacterium]|nr:ArsR family transcriptional regulator [Candidatus Uhrbacteria bacterium]